MKAAAMIPLAVSLCVSGSANAAEPHLDRPLADDAVEARVSAVFARMTPADKLAELQSIRPMDLLVDGKLSLAKCRELIPHGIGQVCQIGSSQQLSPTELRDLARELQHWLVTETPARIAAILHDEALTGFPSVGATVFPQAIGMGCTWNPALAEQKARMTAATFRAAGVTLALSPMLDLCRSAHWPRLEESFGEDPYLTSAMGLAFVRGLQGGDLRTGVAATGKHFAAYGGEPRSDHEFFEEYLMPFEVAIQRGDLQCVMPGYHRYQGVPCAGNAPLLTHILREELGFRGLVVSDYGAVNMMIGAKYAANAKDAAAKAINAGMDVEFAKGLCFPHLAEAVAGGAVSQHTVDEAVRRSLRLKARLGLLDDHLQVGDDGPLDFDPAAHRRLAYEAACESLVLLKNDGVLPLAGSVTKVALVGPNAASVQALLGDYTYQSMAAFWWGIPTNPENPKLVTLLQGLQSRAGGRLQIRYERGCDWSEPYESKLDSSGAGDPRLLADSNARLTRIKQLVHAGVPPADWNRALQYAAASDVIIAAMGENQYLCGEGRERKGIRLPGRQEEFVQRLLDTGRPVILVLFGGRQQVIDTLAPCCAAIVRAWFPGEEGGNAVADLLLGNINPSGKLCVTYPLTDAKQSQCYNEGYSATQPPLYPFGHGLSYTRYEYRDLQVPAAVPTSAEWINVAVNVKNAGHRAGAEVVQVYVAPREPAAGVKAIQLEAFGRVELQPGQERQLTFRLSPQQLAQWDGAQWIIAPGAYELRAAASATDVRLRASFALTGEPRRLKTRDVWLAEAR